MPGLGLDPLHGVRQTTLRPGAQAVTPKGAALQILGVHGGDFRGNEGSSILDVRWSPTGPPGSPHRDPCRIVLCGDAEEHGLAAMLSSRDGRPAALAPGPVDALLLPHHGSKARYLSWLLDHLRPREVWVSGSDPAVDPEEFRRRGIQLRSTSEVGGFLWQSGSR